ncbi:hypothetical protein KI387_027689 [Taxus chinensis]|uniref:Transmembrane protein n=1 Tax=Taxus chinensis TaxID=29808 RepID=A0AA38FYA2_TAXCH|nr:hypothetical protein KI387_027689 [Taxus chinensis]
MENNDVHENGNGSAYDALIDDNGLVKSKDHGWTTVVNPKRLRKTQNKEASSVAGLEKVKSNGDAGKSLVFQSLEQHAEERRKKAEVQRAAAAANAGLGSERNGKITGSGSEEDSDGEGADGDILPANAEEKKPKQKKPKKPKVTLSEAAAKIDAENLTDFLKEVTASYENAPDIQLRRFADYFARAFTSVNPAQFPLNKILKESSVAKLAETPLCHVPEVVYKTSTDWINQQPLEALKEFTLWALCSVLEDIATHQPGHKGSKQIQPVSAKGTIAIFVVLAMVLRRRPEILVQLSTTIKTGPQFQGQDKVYMIVWAITQACQSDLVVGMSLWVQNLLPLAVGKTSTPLYRDITLQWIESCMLENTKKARPILLNNPIRKGERVVPPAALNNLMQVAFPIDSARTKATERFVAIYPFVKELTLAGAHRSKSTRPVAQQLLPLSLMSISEENPSLTNEAAGIFIWCLSQNSDCYKQWEKLHIEHIKASTIILEKLSADWKNSVSRLSPTEDLKKTLKSLRSKHQHALESEEGDDKLRLYVKSADKYCKTMLGRLSRTTACIKATIVSTLLAVLIAFCIMLAMPSLESVDWKKYALMFRESFSL